MVKADDNISTVISNQCAAATDDSLSDTHDTDMVQTEAKILDGAINDSTEETDDEFNVPKDKGWAWMVLLGALLVMTLLMGMLKSAGIMFVAFQGRFNSSSSMTSLLSTVQNAVFSLAAPLVLSVGKSLTSSRILMFIGSSFVFLSYVITSQAKDMRILFISYGVLQGLGNAFVVPVAIVTLATYFDKRRGFANSIALSGSSIGGFLFAPLLTYLLNEYGHQGCFLIIAGILLNGFVCGALFRPLSFYKRNVRAPLARHLSERIEQTSLFVKESQRTSNSECKDVLFANCKEMKRNGEGIEQATLLLGQVKELPQSISESEDVPCENGKDMEINVQIYKYKDREKIDGIDSEPYTVNGADMYNKISHKYRMNSLQHINDNFKIVSDSMTDISADTHVNTSTNTNTVEAKHGTSVKVLIKTMIRSFDFSLFKNPLFCVLLLSSFIICANAALCTVYVAPYAKDIGLGPDEIALIVIVNSATDFVCRMIVAAIADRGWIRRSNLTALSVAVVGVSAIFVQYYRNFQLLMCYAVILGLFAGVYFSLFTVLIVDYLSMQKLQTAFGFTALIHGGGISLFYYIVGYLRDVTEAYVIPYQMMGCLCLVGSGLHFSLPFIERYSKHKGNGN